MIDKLGHIHVDPVMVYVVISSILMAVFVFVRGIQRHMKQDGVFFGVILPTIMTFIFGSFLLIPLVVTIICFCRPIKWLFFPPEKDGEEKHGIEIW